MATGRPKKLFASELTTGQVTYYTQPGSGGDDYTIATHVNVTLRDSSKVSIWVIDTPGSPDDNNVVWDNVKFEVEVTQMFPVVWILEAGDKIVAQAEKANAVTLRIDGIEVT